MAQNGQIKKRGQSWVLKYRMDVLENGVVVRKQVLKRLAPIDAEHRTESSVRHLAAALLAPINSRTARPQTDQTLFDFIDKTYMGEIRSSNDLRPSTKASYAALWKLLLPYVNGRKLKDVRTSDIEAMLRALASSKALSKSSFGAARSFLSGVFRYAIRNDYVDHMNPVRECKVPKGEAKIPELNHAYTLEEVTAILKALPEPARTTVATAAFSGLRKGEIRGIQWTDLVGDELHVRRNVWRTFVGDTKTDGSAAPVPVIPMLRKILEAHRKRTGSSSKWVFTGRDGDPLNLQNLARRVIIPALSAADLKWYGWHAFRRGLASNLFALGVEPLIVQRILRHANVQLTMAHYIKTVDAQSVDAMKKLERALKGRRK
jgi:integrase